jgi:hypothetical protein
MGRNIAVFSEDGSAHRSAPGFNEDGRWTKKGGSYEIDWSSGREIDLVVMKDNYQRLGGRDKKGREIILGVRVRESDQ